jgi:hypothetical protein
MTKRIVKEELKKEDLFFSTFDQCRDWVIQNTKTAIIAVVAVVALALLGWAYTSYMSSRNDRVQSTLSAAIRDYQEYAVSKKADALPKAEASFKKTEKEGSGAVRDVARIYLARIALIQGKKDVAKSLYDQVARNAADQVTKRLAETGLQEIAKAN